LFTAIASNLKKNSRSLRLKSLEVLSRFEVLKFLRPEAQDANIDEHFDSSLDCELVKLMKEFEETEIGFLFEKSKIITLQRIENIISSDVMPVIYLETAYSFLLGCYWIKFTPLFEHVHEAMVALFKCAPPSLKHQLVLKHFETFQTVSWLSQIEGHTNDTLRIVLLDNLNKTEVVNENSLALAYIQDCSVNEEFLEVKDYFYQITKAIGFVMGPVVLQEKVLREALF
jgi:hypothetical protein